MPRQKNHLATHVHSNNLAKNFGQCIKNSTNATPYLEDSHFTRVHPLANVGHIIQNIALDGQTTGLKEFLLIPVLFPGSYEMKRIFRRPFIPIPPHTMSDDPLEDPLNLSFQGDPKGHELPSL